MNSSSLRTLHSLSSSFGVWLLQIKLILMLLLLLLPLFLLLGLDVFGKIMIAQIVVVIIIIIRH